MSKHLPRSLKIQDERYRADLLKATTKPGIRIILGLADLSQPFPHAGVILRDREIVGWISGLMQEFVGGGSELVGVYHYGLVLRENLGHDEMCQASGRVFPTRTAIKKEEYAEKAPAWSFHEPSFFGLYSPEAPLSLHLFGSYSLETIVEFRDYEGFDYRKAC